MMMERWFHFPFSSQRRLLSGDVATQCRPLHRATRQSFPTPCCFFFGKQVCVCVYVVTFRVTVFVRVYAACMWVFSPFFFLVSCMGDGDRSRARQREIKEGDVCVCVCVLAHTHTHMQSAPVKETWRASDRLGKSCFFFGLFWAHALFSLHVCLCRCFSSFSWSALLIFHRQLKEERSGQAKGRRWLDKLLYPNPIVCAELSRSLSLLLRCFHCPLFFFFFFFFLSTSWGSLFLIPACRG